MHQAHFVKDALYAGKLYSPFSAFSKNRMIFVTVSFWERAKRRRMVFTDAN